MECHLKLPLTIAFSFTPDIKENTRKLLKLVYSRVYTKPTMYGVLLFSEWMGFYLLHESMLDSVIKARDKHLQVNIFCDFYDDN